ncbi:MAG: endolytic transglycosylase MltG [Acidobacteria bacterium]|nr:endolytic transglycosylase MltG [Acidobacteriota bacterium]MBW4045840.1 endolytic transglycosylase MltG [Acidobacteriota bacterium]
MKRFFGLLLLLIVVAASTVAFVLLTPTGPHTETFLEIAPGTPTMKIAAQLQRQGFILNRYVFEALHVVRGGSLKAGEYRFDHPSRMSEVYSRLVRGDVYTRALTIPEGANIFDIAQRVEAAQLGSREAFLAAARKDTALISDIDPLADSLEGYLFPDTYHFERLVTPEHMVATMVRRFREAAALAGLTSGFHKVIIIASLVEKETPIDSERPLVASVFENRLAQGMPLMTDPSVIYAALLDGRYRGTIYQSDLAADSPYNTYKHAGLPPGPVCNPGMTSIKAAMSPAKSNYLYFVAAGADPAGHSRFAATLEEHQRNVAAYRHAVHAGGTQ